MQKKEQAKLNHIKLAELLAANKLLKQWLSLAKIKVKTNLDDGVDTDYRKEYIEFSNNDFIRVLQEVWYNVSYRVVLKQFPDLKVRLLLYCAYPNLINVNVANGCTAQYIVDNYDDCTEMIENCLLNFDFKKVHKVMKVLDWRWVKPDTMSEIEVPDESKLYDTANNLLFEAMEGALNNHSNQYTATGGFEASVEFDQVEHAITYIGLKFVLEESEIFNE